MSLSSYSSIFEVLAGLLIVFTGLEVATQSLTKKINQIIYQISTALDKVVARTALLDKTEYKYSIDGFISLQKSAKELNSYYLSLSALGSKKVRTINGEINLGELLLKKKFIPVFLYATFFTFYNLVLCGISNTDEVLYFDNVTLKGEDIGFKTLFFFNLWSLLFINVFVFRNYRIPYKPYKIKNPIKYYWRNLSRWTTALKVFITSAIGFVLALFFTVITDFTVETVYFKLFIVFLSIFISIYPFLSLFIWLNIGFNVKRRYIEKWSNELVACLNSEEVGKINIENRKN